MVGKYAFKFEPTAWLGLARVIIYTGAIFYDFGWDEQRRAAAMIILEAALTTLNRSFVSPAGDGR